MLGRTGDGMKTATIHDFLTEEQIKKCQEICENNGLPNKVLVEQVIQPNLEEINKKLGQENSASYLAYVVEFAFLKLKSNSM